MSSLQVMRATESWRKMPLSGSLRKKSRSDRVCRAGDRRRRERGQCIGVNFHMAPTGGGHHKFSICRNRSFVTSLTLSSPCRTYPDHEQRTRGHAMFARYLAYTVCVTGTLAACAAPALAYDFEDMVNGGRPTGG